MTEYLTPANSNLSFSDVRGSGERERINKALGSTLELLKEAGASKSMIAESLFELVMFMMRPPKGSPDQDNIVWYAQLQRFRDDLQQQIDAIEDVLDEDSH